MSRLLLISLGQLTGHILEALARTGAFHEIVVGGRNPEYGAAKVNLARIGAAIEGRFPSIEFREIDVNRADAGATIRSVAPDVALAAPSMMPWWRLERLKGRTAEMARRISFAGWIACHLAPMLAVRRAWSDSGLEVPWVGASYPDVVNAILHRTGSGPVCGVGNIDELVPKIRLSLAAEMGWDPLAIEIRLVAQHALEYFAYAGTQSAPGDAPPFLVKATVEGQDVSQMAAQAMLRAWPIPYDRDFNLLTASSAAVLLPALAGQRDVRMHVPAPLGMVGGYPVRIDGGAVILDLPPEWSREQAVTVNLASLAWDGIQSIEEDGTVLFTQATAEGLHTLLGKAEDALRPEDSPAMARALIEALDPG